MRVKTDELREFLIDPDPEIRRQVWGALEDDIFEWEVLHARALVVLQVLGDEQFAHAWPDCIEIFRAMRPNGMVFTLLVRALTVWELSGPGGRLLDALGVPAGTTLPDFTTESVGELRIECLMCERERTEARVCRQVAALVMLLASRTESVRRLALERLGNLGPGVAPILRTVRRSKLPGRCDVLQVLAEFGWEEIDSADAGLLRRLIRSKQLTEVPQPMELRAGWFAVPTTDQAAVLEAMDLHNPAPATLRMGFDRYRWERTWQPLPINSFSWPSEYQPNSYLDRGVFVTPGLDGWTLIVGDTAWADGIYGDEPDDEVRRRCRQLSRRFGTAHWYSHGDNGHGWDADWCVAADGVLQQGCVVLDDEVVVLPDDSGRKSTVEQLRAWLNDNDHGTGHREPIPDSFRVLSRREAIAALRGKFQANDNVDDIVEDEVSYRPNALTHWEFGVKGVSWRLSVNPERLGPHTRIEGTGVLAVPADVRDERRRGAYPI
ncbi:hypothetical protein [Nocardia arthritidis]|uniref:Uncharacterized protein n=1 Tax=Nocardia arthritidis TaxID=228602 RepID=A0A6G9YTL1_9NOCA|nr:hypothetical protein [Nocardia arthritidis]QIS16431.1 hypothetical protein F5544_43115 [Nocardia arthritidis]